MSLRTPGSGKSTILNIIEQLFEVTLLYSTLVSSLAATTPSQQQRSRGTLVAIQHDGDLSKIYDNTKLNSIVSHEMMTVNEKYKTPFEARSNAFSCSWGPMFL